MTLSNKRALIQYLEFLKSSGYLYMENVSAQVAAEPLPQVQTQSAKEAEPHMKKESAAKPKGKAALQGAEADLFAPETAPAPVPKAKKTSPALPRKKRLECFADAIARAEACRACTLGDKRNKLVYGDGDPEAKIVFVGEAPGGDEDEQGIPFVGRAGQLLNKMIAAIGFKREEVYICNTLKCRPPGNRDPLPSEKEACEHFLVEQLEILRPQILVALGAHAAQYLCRSEESIGRLRGAWHSYQGVALLATYHPAFLLRSPSFKAKAWEDFQAIHKKYCELNPGDQRDIWSKEK